MKTAILYYTFGGNSRRKATELAVTEENAQVFEVKEQKKRNMLTAIFSGCPKAAKRKSSKIQPVNCNLKEYEKVILLAPIWAGFPAPAFNSMVELLPSGKMVELYLLSTSGQAPKSKEGTCQMIRDKDCDMLGYHDVKTGKK